MEHFELFGGKFFAKREAEKRLLALAGQAPALDRRELQLLLSGLLENAPGKRTLEWKGDHTIAGDWQIDGTQEWVADNGIAAVVCFGDLTVEGDLLSYGWDFWPLLIVAGDLKVRNLVKGGLPLFVLGNLVASGYFIADYDDGLLRVGGDLVAAGYMPRCRDFPDAKGHVIAGSIRARTFDMRDPGVDRRHHRAAFVPEAITDGWLDPDKILEREHAGLPVFKDPPDPVPPKEPVVPPPMPAVQAIDPIGLGTLSPVPEAGDRLCEWIVETVPFDPRGFHPGKDFAAIARHLFEHRQDGQVLTLPPGTRLAGDLELEWDADWVQRNRIVALVCEGDLALDGDVLNRNLDSGPILLVGGRLRLRNLIKGGSRVIVLGDLEASGLVVCEYNHGVIRVGRDLAAQAYFILDHSHHVGGAVRAPVLDESEVYLRDELVPEVFASEDETWPEVDWLWARQRAGLPILKPEAEP